MSTNPEKINTGDIISRTGMGDEHEVLSTNQGGDAIETVDLILVRCTKADTRDDGSEPTFQVGEEEYNLPRRYTVVRRAKS